ncbi:hypothetical protein CAPTEDRAFT_223565 [Capitella teleta]|uniref:Uncharacterized protein n=1 Tax=Capitella teleta TaxID=283909 RepID=R7TQF2_CAPTE|nr:hypothetical protein CAPTEDRAFT_223565 [Capitella teleta]|eukprot:ELT95869.1 hypothetical protein CAPTEDRAFT_223565 [Capitella teleta]
MQVRLNPACDELGMVIDRPSRKRQKKAPKSQSKAPEVVIEHAFVHEPPSISQPVSSEHTAPSKQSADLLESVAEFIDTTQDKAENAPRWEKRKLGSEAAWLENHFAVLASVLSSHTSSDTPVKCLFCDNTACLWCKSCKAHLCPHHDTQLHCRINITMSNQKLPQEEEAGF